MRPGAFLCLALVAAPLAAQERSLAIERFDAAIVVNPDASIDVTETIQPRFTGSWNGLYRTIPVAYRTPQGFNWTLRLELLGVTDENGQALRTEVTRERHYLKYKIWIPNAVNARRTVVLRYRARNGLRFFEDHDELYWNITGDEWDVPIEAASARIELPGGASGVRAIAFNGAYGSTAQDADVAIEGTAIRVAMPGGLGFHEGVTAVVGWDKGVVTEPTATDKVAGFLASNWPLFIPIPIFFGMFILWRRKGKDPAKLPVTVQYEPPTGMTPAETGVLIDNSADMRDVTATVVDLAVKGWLRIEERDDSKLFGLIKGSEFVFHRERPPSEWSGLARHEREVLEGVFDGGQATVALSELENEFYKSLPGIKNAVFDRLIERDCYRARPDSVKGRWIGFAILIGLVIGVGGSALSSRLSLTPVPFIVAAAVSALIVGAFALVMPARTVRGARTLEKILGFEEFLERTEGDRLRDVVRTPEMFEKFLPYAMAFGVEKKWAKAFDDLALEPPRWYAGGHYPMFNASLFSSRLSAMSAQTSSTMSSAPRSSSGSGFGGGGSSGGGGGGGGGGGF